jgi:phosphatidylinositol alpha-mannosyltransferase
MLRICITAAYDLAEEGGVKRHAENLARELRRGGDEVLLLAPYSGTRPLEAGTEGLRGVVSVESNGSNSRPGIFVCPWRIYRRIHGRFDVLHTMEPVVPSLNWWAAFFVGSAARVATFHSYNEDERPVARFFRENMGRAQLLLFDRAIAVSEPAAGFARGLWKKPLALIPNGVDTNLFAPRPRRIDSTLRLLFVGHWHNPRKGLPVLLDAYERLLQRGVSVSLDVAGDGGLQPKRTLEGLTYHPAVSDPRRLADLYRAADVFVAPSLGQESFGIVLLEAMACALPVVCSDIDGYRAVVPERGARLVPPGDVEALASALADLATNRPLRQQMAETNRAAAMPYDWSQIAARVREEYVAALDQRRGASSSRREPDLAEAPRVRHAK